MNNPDGATFFHFAATGVTPATEPKMVGLGSQHAPTAHDADGAPLDGGANDRRHLAEGVPVKDFWSVILHSDRSRSMIQTDRRNPSVSSQNTGPHVNDDGLVDIGFGPEAPEGREPNWVQTVPGPTWNAILRLCGPLEPWSDPSWRAGQIARIE